MSLDPEHGDERNWRIDRMQAAIDEHDVSIESFQQLAAVRGEKLDRLNERLAVFERHADEAFARNLADHATLWTEIKESRAGVRNLVISILTLCLTITGGVVLTALTIGGHP